MSAQRDNMAGVDAQHPWIGLASFTESSRAYFHGRDDEITELCRRIQRKPLTVLFGKSGLGKTSILQAGVDSGEFRDLQPRLTAMAWLGMHN